MNAEPKASEKPRFFERHLGKMLVSCALLSAVFSFLLIPLADSSTRLNARQVFDSSRWHSLQLQLQTYRLMDYLSDVDERDLPLQGNAYFQYDLVLSRVDLLRKGELGRHIRNFANGRATRLLNIISGELELISLNIDHLEQGKLDQVPILIERLRALDSQVSDFVVIVNQSANDYVTEKRAELDIQIECIQIISLILLILTAILLIISFKLSKKLGHVFKRNTRLEQRVKDVQAGKFETIRQINAELQPSLIGTLNSSTSLLQQNLSGSINIVLERIASNHQQVLTQLDCYHDLTLIEADQLTPVLTFGSLSQQLSASIESVKQTINSYRIRALCCIDPHLNDCVETDLKRLHEILVTLITQLAPYCQSADLLIQVRPSTLPIVSLPRRSKQHPLKMIQISIRDNGEGLPESIQDGLRSNPHNPNNTIMNQIQQMGMGFTFCHFLISALQGELHFSSSPGKGSEIWIDLPMGVNENEPNRNQDTVPTPDTVMAILESDSLLDQALLQTMKPFVHTMSVTEAQLNEFLLISEPIPFQALFINQIHLLHNEQLDCLLHLKAHGVDLILSQALIQAYPELAGSKSFQYPITPNQLRSITQFSD
ncbi:ATP-binding protein [Marinomonas ostreistagni]|uniref:histidine kinase n=1 Tax=Marinomonas ostreistagni TaxID=359209 RepID=A0ABS0ZC54_9GAMM|nr:ATP-binding protein [Marinomonas ostreistagni]MBJ7551210.1 hypothetical protein [Marinomonas ostreistagni]